MEAPAHLEILHLMLPICLLGRSRFHGLFTAQEEVFALISDLLRSTHLGQALFLPENGRTVSGRALLAEQKGLVVQLAGPGLAGSPKGRNTFSRKLAGKCLGGISCCTTSTLGEDM